MRSLCRRGAIALAALVALAAMAPVGCGSTETVTVTEESAKAPERARIGPTSMGEADLSDTARPWPSGGAPAGDPFKGWGRVRFGACFEWLCTWPIKRGGDVTVQFNPVRRLRVSNLRTSGPAWRTSRDIGRGSSPVEVRRAYGSRARRMLSCRVNDFGAPVHGIRVNHRNSFWFFELTGPNGRKVRAVWLGRGKLPVDSGC
jgi:hypothetical protein